MSALKMGLHGKKNLKTTIQKIMKISEICKEINCGGVSLESNFSFFSVHSNFTYDYLENSHSESSQTTTMELLCGKLVNLL